MSTMSGATTDGIYNEVIKALPIAEQLRLATLILNGIPEQAVVDFSTEWSEEDLKDFSNSSLARLVSTEEE